MPPTPLHPPTLWVESSCTQKHGKTELIISYRPEVVTSLLGGSICGTERRGKPFGPAIHRHIY